MYTHCKVTTRFLLTFFIVPDENKIYKVNCFLPGTVSKKTVNEKKIDQNPHYAHLNLVNFYIKDNLSRNSEFVQEKIPILSLCFTYI